MDYVDYIYDRLISRGIDEAAVKQVHNRTSQIRFSESTRDLHNLWDETSVSVFAAKGKKVTGTVIRDMGAIDRSIDGIVDACNRIPGNPEYMGMSHTPAGEVEFPLEHVDPGIIEEYATAMVNGASDGGAERSAGVVYRRDSEIRLRTGYNDLSYSTGGTELVIRAFAGQGSGQENYHFGPSVSSLPIDPHDMGASAAETAVLGKKAEQGQAGEFTVLMSPYVIGNILSYSSGFLSADAIHTGLSCFAGLEGKKAASEAVTLYDDPLDYSGVGARPFDDEGTPTRRNTLIGKGVLKTYLHSHSTAVKDSAETTGNAGILSPMAWQLSMEPGSESFRDMLSGIDDGLFINNTWYTRFQDYRNGMFSTVPRDGIFRIRNGKIAESWSGIRISDSVPNILNNIRSVSREAKHAKWWLEIEPVIMPYAVVDGVNITKSF